MEARVTAHSQAHRLRERMKEAEIRHGEEIRADLPGIRVASYGSEWFTTRRRITGEVFFCTMGPIRVRKVTISGDEHPLPTNVIVDGLEVAAGGTYDLLNVLVRSNGDLRLIVDDATRIQRVTREGVESSSDLTFA